MAKECPSSDRLQLFLYNMITSCILILVVSAVDHVVIISADSSIMQDHTTWMPMKAAAAARHCQLGNSIADCLGGGEEVFNMDSEINRRILATTNYISYGALQRNTVPCSRRGASYYNCQPGAEANPYTRGCTAITRCRS